MQKMASENKKDLFGSRGGGAGGALGVEGGSLSLRHAV